MDDRALLLAYVRSGSAEDFAAIVRANAGIVYAAARRQVDEDVADDVTQTVFILLMRRARGVKGSLAGWLIVTTRYVCREAIRSARRREHHERRATAMKSELAASTAGQWEEYRGHFDKALAALKREDRDAILLRYFRDMELREVGRALGLSEKAAQKRVSRAVERLRGILSRGIRPSGVARPAADALVMELAARGAKRAPESLIQSVIAVGPGSVVKAAPAFDLARQASRMMMWVRAATVVSVVALLAAVGGGVVAIEVVVRGSNVQAQPEGGGGAAPAESFSAAGGTGAATRAGSPEDAAAVYARADAIFMANWKDRKVDSPDDTNWTFPAYPPYGDRWNNLEAADYLAGSGARAMVHGTAEMNFAAWPALSRSRADPNNLNYLKECRVIANHVGDAALYEALVLHDEPGAMESIEDLFHLGDLLENQRGYNIVRMLVSVGIRTLATARAEVIIANAAMTIVAAGAHDLPVTTAEAWIGRLLNHGDAQAELDRALQGEPAGAKQNPIVRPSLDRALRTVRRYLMERDLAAMSIAAHVYRFRHERWPGSLGELQTELPRVPIDPFGDGKQTLGYVLARGGLPDGSDRPLVFSRADSGDGLFYRVGEPAYSFYLVSGAAANQKHGGQFRDIAGWSPPEGWGGATTRAVGP